jgi:hypothetical protein
MLQVSMSPHQRDVYIEFLIELIVVLWSSFMPLVAEVTVLAMRTVDATEFSVVCFWIELE